jgi:hypothetical protein
MVHILVMIRPFLFGCVQIEFFLKFKAINHGTCIGQQTFELLKPFFVKPMREHNTSCFIYHVEFDELKLGLNNMQTH